MENDITKSFFAIHKLRRAAYSKMKRFPAPHTVDGRHSDAFVYVFSGSCSYKFDNRSFVAEGGDMIYLSKGEKYEMLVTSEKYDVIFCDFDFEVGAKRKSICVKPTSSALCDKYFSELYRYHSEGKEAEAMSRLYKIYALFSPPSIVEDNKTQSKAFEIKKLIDNRFTSRDFSLSDLSTELSISDAYVRRLFIKHFGTQPIKYLNTLRINKAKELLKYSLISLDECASESGFCSTQYFCRVFKNAVGKTPGEYREEKFRSI